MADFQNWCCVNPVIDYRMRGLCVKPYAGHPKGCPNFKKEQRCPPAAPRIHSVLDFTEDIYAVYNVFPIGEHVKRMQLKHQHWSERQLYCCLYWQGTARKQLRGIISRFHEQYPELYIVNCPEAQGVNITDTMLQAGIQLEWPPKTVAYQVVLAGQSLAEEVMK